MPDITSKLELHYKFEDPGTAADSSGNERHGTPVNSPSLVQGKFNVGYNFVAGNLQHVTIGSQAATKDITVAAWVRKSAAVNQVIAKYGLTLLRISSTASF